MHEEAENDRPDPGRSMRIVSTAIRSPAVLLGTANGRVGTDRDTGGGNRRVVSIDPVVCYPAR